MLLFKCVLILLFVYYFLWSLFLNFSFTSFFQVIWPFLQNCILVSSMLKRIFLNSFHNKYSSFSGYLICVHIWTHLWLVYSSLLIPVQYHLQGSMETLFSFSSFAPLAFKYSFKVLCGIVIFFFYNQSTRFIKVMKRCLVYSVCSSLSSTVIPHCLQTSFTISLLFKNFIVPMNKSLSVTSWLICLLFSS